MKTIVQNICILITVVVALLTISVVGKTIEVNCSEFCVCDIYQRLRRATCQNKRLTSMEINMASAVQILDMSYNQVSDLSNDIFLELQLSELKLLNLSHNKIGQIHLNGFNGLSALKTLDLSYNAVRYFIRAWFFSLSSLEELYLRGNPLRTINDQPRIEIKSLRILDLSDCKIAHLKSDIFSLVPNLEVLDVSNNYLTEFKPEIIKPLYHISVVNLVGNNFFNCKDISRKNLKKYTRHKGIALRDTCTTQKSHVSQTHMFEKMMVQPNNAGELEKNSWIYNVEETIKVIEVCSNLTNNKTWDGLENVIMEYVEVYPLIILPGIFGSGILFGILFGCICGCLCRPKKCRPDIIDDDEPNEYNNLRRSMRSLRSQGANSYVRSSGFRNSRPRDEIRNLVLNELDYPNSTPVYPRKIYTG
ncbi:amphoterin-induced protein 2-like [Cylas formicarius]|uniref:amphoterin-induced protein 2-like n=1 Tax=Cylas formicarius TaxID=197179 RepID=UPI0029587DB2|nr:amphoterin-induced protein 2-like [Cylas formicarius]